MQVSAMECRANEWTVAGMAGMHTERACPARYSSSSDALR
jgi:hypothetical protein